MFLLSIDQSFYFQPPQRFQSPFPASRNGFFPSNGLPNLVQSLPQPIPRSQLRGPIQQSSLQQQTQQQQQDQSIFGAAPSNDGPTSEYFQYSAFPVSSINGSTRLFNFY